MSYIRAWIHYVWSTKYRRPTLNVDEFREGLFHHIKENAILKHIYLDRVNGYWEHIHCLVSLGSGQTLDQIAQLIKGESSYWYNNKSGFNAERLRWQDDYYAVSVSESALERVRAYIDNQVEHHRKKSFVEEYEELIRTNGYGKLG